MKVFSLLKALSISKELAPSKVAQAPPAVILKALSRCKRYLYL